MPNPYIIQKNKKPPIPEALFFLGGDPEVFVKDRATGKIVPSCNKVGGLKGAGLPFGPKPYEMSILEDNVAVEFNFAPQTDQYKFMDAVQHVTAHADQFLTRKGLEAVYSCTHKFTNEQLATEKAQVFGCDPDFCAYDPLDAERIVDPSKIGNYRFCGGHIHLGFSNPEKIPLSAIAILLDMFIGLPSLQFDEQGQRRQYYGLAGLYRPKSYGLEYRTMANWWLRPEQFDYAHRMARECYTLMYYIHHNVDALGTLFEKMPLKDVEVSINQENKKAAREVWQQAQSYASEQGMQLGANFPFYSKHEL